MIAVIQFARPVCLVVLMCAGLLRASGQDQQDEHAVLQKSIDEKNFVFVAQTVTPLRGGLRQLTSYYDLKVAKDTLTSNLPYFGRAFVAPYNPTDAGLSFTSTQFEYKVKNGKKEKREVNINVRAAGDLQRMFLTVFDGGSASLRVNSNNRDPVTFNGYVKEAGTK